MRPDYWPAAGHARTDQLESELVQKLCDDIARNALPGDVSVARGGQGEPLLHPGFRDAVESLSELPQVTRVFVETFGMDLTEDVLIDLAALPMAAKISIIVRLNTLQQDRYRKMYGVDRLADVLAALERLAAKDYPFERFVEVQRLRDNEDELDAFFERFDKGPVGIILQKFNSYARRLNERRASDLTPMMRDFCWHLARDLYLIADGRVPICKQDPFGEQPTLDFRALSVSEIFAQTLPHHAASVRGEHERIPMPCMQCDEWYTFNG